MGSAADVDSYKKSKNLSGAAMHVTAKVTQEANAAYGIKYIPHKVLLDKEGKVVKNFSMGGLRQELDDLLAAGGLLPQSESQKDD